MAEKKEIICRYCERPIHQTRLIGSCPICAPADEDDFLIGKTCNPDAPEECESCQ